MLCTVLVSGRAAIADSAIGVCAGDGPSAPGALIEALRQGLDGIQPTRKAETSELIISGFREGWISYRYWPPLVQLDVAHGATNELRVSGNLKMAKQIGVTKSTERAGASGSGAQVNRLNSE